MTVYRERISPKKRRAMARYLKVSINDICEICGKHIQVQIFKGEGICSTLCKKARDNDHEPASGTLDASGNLVQHKAKKRTARMVPNPRFPLGG